RPMTQPNLKESPKPALKNAANQTNANDKSQVQQRFTTIPEGERKRAWRPLSGFPWPSRRGAIDMP
ncbi:MAG: hypothetical protein AAGC95_11820, partial [Pseudomonadota bacterium]